MFELEAQPMMKKRNAVAQGVGLEPSNDDPSTLESANNKGYRIEGQQVESHAKFGSQAVSVENSSPDHVGCCCPL